MKPASQKRLCPPGNGLSRSGAPQHSVSAERATRQQLNPKGADSLSLSRKRACGSTSGLSQGQGLQGPPLTIGYRELLGSGGWGGRIPKVGGGERETRQHAQEEPSPSSWETVWSSRRGGQGWGGRSPPLLPRCSPTAPRSPRCPSPTFHPLRAPCAPVGWGGGATRWRSPGWERRGLVPDHGRRAGGRPHGADRVRFRIVCLLGEGAGPCNVSSSSQDPRVETHNLLIKI